MSRRRGGVVASSCGAGDEWCLTCAAEVLSFLGVDAS